MDNIANSLVIIIIVMIGCGVYFIFYLDRKKQYTQAKEMSEKYRAETKKKFEMCAEDERKKEENYSCFLNKIVNDHGNKHGETLLRKRMQMIITDDYGVEDNSKWIKELRYFVDRVVMPDVLDYLEQHYQSHEYNESEIVDGLITDIDKSMSLYLKQN